MLAQTSCLRQPATHRAELELSPADSQLLNHAVLSGLLKTLSSPDSGDAKLHTCSHPSFSISFGINAQSDPRCPCII